MENKRKVMLLNAALLACAVWMGWAFYQGRAAGSEALEAAAGDEAPRNRYALPADRAVTAAGSQVIARNPFSADRNIIVEEPVATVPAGPPPQLPVVIGTMRLRDHYEALVAESAANAGASFKQVKVGDVFAGYTIAEIRDDEIVVERSGQRSTINVYLSASSVVRNTARTVPADAAPPGAPAARVESAAAQPTVTTAAAAPAAAPVQLPSPDPWLKITVEGNRRRYERTTMFGPQIWYEDIK